MFFALIVPNFLTAEELDDGDSPSTVECHIQQSAVYMSQFRVLCSIGYPNFSTEFIQIHEGVLNSKKEAEELAEKFMNSIIQEGRIYKKDNTIWIADKISTN